MIVTATLDAANRTELNRLRARHFPSERNHLDAHLTLFHRLADGDRSAIEAALARVAGALPLVGQLTEPRNLGRGVAFGIDCPGLVDIRGRLAAQMPSPLGAQDAAWRWPHVTVQNKVKPAEARALLEQLTADFAPRPVEIVGFALWRYLGGPWEPLGEVNRTR